MVGFFEDQLDQLCIGIFLENFIAFQQNLLINICKYFKCKKIWNSKTVVWALTLNQENKYVWHIATCMVFTDMSYDKILI